MKKLLSMFLILTLVLSMCMTAVFADNHHDNKGKGSIPPGLAKKGVPLPPGIAKKIFDDIDEFPWAKQAIEMLKLKGLVNGYDQGRFAPANPVTKLKTVIMALRIMGWEDEIKSIRELPSKYKGKEVSDWAKGYVTVAYEKGILDDVDMMYFNPQEPAKRYEVAKYVIRALGYDEEAREHMKASLRFVDASAVPVGSVGYVYMISKFEIMNGDNEQRFNPMGTLTRAEMAVLFYRLDKKVDNSIDKNKYTGKIYSINDEKIALRIDGQLISFLIDEDVVVYDNNKRIEYEDLEKNSMVLIQIKNNYVTYIEIIDEKSANDKLISVFNGKVISINKSGTKELTIQSERMKVIFEVADNVQVYFTDKKGSFSDIVIDDVASIVVDNKNRATKITINRKLADSDKYLEKISGSITKLDLVGTYNIYIDNEKYPLSKDARVKLNGKTASLKDLEVDMDVEAYLQDGIIITINAEDIGFDFLGIIKAMDENEITIEKENGRTVTYDISRSVIIKIDGRTNKTLDDLSIDDVAEFKIQNDKIIRIEVTNQHETVKGIIEEVTSDTISISSNDKIKEYEYANVIVTRINNRVSSYNKLVEGMDATLKVKNGLVYNIDAKDREFEIEGIITKITQTNNGYSLTLKVGKREYTYDVDKNVEIYINNEKNNTLSDLAVGQECEFEIINRNIIVIEILD